MEVIEWAGPCWMYVAIQCLSGNFIWWQDDVDQVLGCSTEMYHGMEY